LRAGSIDPTVMTMDAIDPANPLRFATFAGLAGEPAWPHGEPSPLSLETQRWTRN
jgi:hypothetical protein